MYYSFLVMLAFEACVFLVHFTVMRETLEKGFDFSDVQAMALSVMWGIAASFVPVVTIYSLYLFGRIKKKVVEVTRNNLSSDIDPIVHTSEKFSSLSAIFGFIFLILIIFEIGIFYEFFKEPGAFYGSSGGFSWATLIPAVGVTTIHMVITGIVMGVVFAYTHEKVNKFIIEKLG